MAFSYFSNFICCLAIVSDAFMVDAALDALETFFGLSFGNVPFENPSVF
jgi:hypothetical protein